MAYTELAHEQAQNVLLFLHEATTAEISAGLSWYSGVRSFCQRLASDFGFVCKQAAGVVAVLSPNTPWHKNLEYAEAAVSNFEYVGGEPLELKNYGVRTFNTSIKKAYHILKDEDYSQVSGRKVSSFWSNIWNVESVDVTHDVWSYRVVSNDLSLLNKAFTEKQYNTAVLAYHLAFQQSVGILQGLEYPYQLQAIVWEVARRLSSQKVSRI